MTALEADLTRAIASIVQAEKDLRSADSGFRIELAAIAREVSIERGITRDLVAAVDRRMDEFDLQSEKRHRALLAAIEMMGMGVAR